MTTDENEKEVKLRIVTINGEKFVEMYNGDVVLARAKRIVVGGKVYKAPSNSG